MNFLQQATTNAGEPHRIIRSRSEADQRVPGRLQSPQDHYSPFLLPGLLRNGLSLRRRRSRKCSILRLSA